MNITRTYTFKRADYDKDGFNIHNGQLFLEYLRECEIDFFHHNLLYQANHLFGNDSVMYLLRSCVLEKDNIDYGMDLIDGEIDLDTNLEIEKYSGRGTVYALVGALAKDDDPLWLIIDDSCREGTFELKYMEEDEDGEEEIVDVPVVPEFVYV